MKGLRRIQWFSIFLLASCLTACQVTVSYTHLTLPTILRV